MPLPLQDTSTDLDLSVLEDLDFDHTPKCDNETCDNDATHLIKCNCGKGTEYSCMECIISMKEGALRDLLGGVIAFDPNKSCGHVTLINLCEIAPI